MCTSIQLLFLAAIAKFLGPSAFIFLAISKASSALSTAVYAAFYY